MIVDWNFSLLYLEESATSLIDPLFLKIFLCEQSKNELLNCIIALKVSC